MRKELLLLVMILLPLAASADIVEIDGVFYNLDSSAKTAEVTKNPNKYTGTVVIPESVTYENVNYCVTSIGDYAFWDCFGLTSITIPNSVTSIGNVAFYQCSGLTSMCVESENSVYDSRNGCNAIIETARNTLIAGCKNTIIPNSVTSIGAHAFQWCSGLTSITIPNSVTSIGDYAFQWCRALTSVTIPNRVTSIGDFAFAGCSGLTSISVESANSAYDSRNGCNAIIETATNTLVAGCKNTIIPNSVTSIGDGAFVGCSGLTSVTIPGSVTSIGVYAFYECRGLTSITIPNRVTIIARYAFCYCSGLTSVTIPNSVTSIGDNAFRDCSGLTSITIPNSVTSIEGSAFEDCSGLISVTIPNSMTSIGAHAFYNCHGLTSVKVLATTPPTAYSAFNKYTIPLYVPAESIDAYKAANPWKNFNEIVPLGEAGETIKMAVASGDRTAIGYSSANGLDFTNVTDVKAWVVTGFTADATVLLSRVKIVPPNTGLYLTSDVAGVEVNVPTTDRDVYYMNMLLAAVNEVTIDPTEVRNGVEYTNFVVGKLNSGEMGFVRVKNTRTLGPNKSRLLVPSSYYPVSNQAPELQVTFTEDASTTDLRGVDATQQSDSHFFDLQGRKLSVGQAQKGIYIYKGKKYVKK